jgi:hypothetical protein
VERVERRGKGEKERCSGILRKDQEKIIFNDS